MSDYTDPAKTLKLLIELETMGFSNRAFSIVHHSREPQTIKTHRTYCESHIHSGSHFEKGTGGTNALVQRRLEIVLNAYLAGRFTCKSSALFEYLANAALLEIPKLN